MDTEFSIENSFARLPARSLINCWSQLGVLNTSFGSTVTFPVAL